MGSEYYMRQALHLAREAFHAGEVPVGAVIVREGHIIGRGRNRREERRSVLGHAELDALEEACRALKDWRLTDCDLYVTLEPCPMCAGALINARVRRIFYGTRDAHMGACGSVLNLFDYPYNHKPELVAGVRGEEAAKLLSDFFRELRVKRKKGN